MNTSLTIIVVSYNTRELTLRALEAAYSASRGIDAKIAVADNASSDGTAHAVRDAFPDTPFMEYSDNPGYGAAINRTFSALPASYLCALNADVLLSPDSLLALCRFLATHPKCGLAGPALVGRDGRSQLSCKRFPTLGIALAELFALPSFLPRNRWTQRYYYAGEDLGAPAWVEWVSGAVMLIRGEAFQAVGGFDADFRMYFEETDLCWRLRQAGYTIGFCPQTTAVHWHGASTIQTSVRQVEYYLSYIRFFRKHRGLRPARSLAAAIAVSTGIRMLALPFKYPPVSKRRLDLLRPKITACRRLLGSLRLPEIKRTSAETKP